MKDALKVGRRTVRFTHPDKVLFPQAGITKRDLAKHLEAAAALMLPYVKERPLALQVSPTASSAPATS